jgi:hypothetical protein
MTDSTQSSHPVDLAGIRSTTLECLAALGETSARSAVVLAKCANYDISERGQRKRETARRFQAWSDGCMDALHLLKGDKARTGEGSRSVEDISDVIDLPSEEVSQASELARALVTARMSGDLTDFTELLVEIKQIAQSRASEPGSSDFLTALVASLSMISAVMIRSAELSGLETDTGQPLLQSLFCHLIEARAEL